MITEEELKQLITKHEENMMTLYLSGEFDMSYALHREVMTLKKVLEK